MAPARRDPRGAAPEALSVRGGEQAEGSAAPPVRCLSGREEAAAGKARKQEKSRTQRGKNRGGRLGGTLSGTFRPYSGPQELSI